MEHTILDFWSRGDLFRKSLEHTHDKKPYIFYDGPPFATGSPHYGHLLVARSRTSCRATGRCGGATWSAASAGTATACRSNTRSTSSSACLPPRSSRSSASPVQRGVPQDRVSATSRSGATRSRAWAAGSTSTTTTRPWTPGSWSRCGGSSSSSGTRDCIYQGVKVMPISTELGTPLSNFEATSNYQDVQDPAITVRFETRATKTPICAAWTTTPWTLPSNLALCVGPDIDYAKVRDRARGVVFYIAEARARRIPQERTTSRCSRRCTGRELVGRSLRAAVPVLRRPARTKVRSSC